MPTYQRGSQAVRAVRESRLLATALSRFSSSPIDLPDSAARHAFDVHDRRPRQKGLHPQGTYFIVKSRVCGCSPAGIACVLESHRLGENYKVGPPRCASPGTHLTVVDFSHYSEIFSGRQVLASPSDDKKTSWRPFDAAPS
jgi:hypothetical protein